MFRPLFNKPLIILLFVFSFFCVMLSLLRVFATDSVMFMFLNWNLVLAIVPWAISHYALQTNNGSKFKLILLIVCWVLFFPNAPYILTDLFHLHKSGDMPLWFDLILILSFAICGLMFGIVSLLNIEQLAATYFDKRVVSSMVVVLLFAAAFGVYLGRYMRWNSWDLLLSPFDLLLDILDRFIHPFRHGRTWGLTLLLGTTLNFFYFLIRQLRYPIAH